MSEAVYDVFLSHASGDKPAVEVYATRLRAEHDLSPFLDRWHLTPGVPWQDELGAAITASRSMAVFVSDRDGPWRHEEFRVAVDRAARTANAFRVFAVLLDGADPGKLPAFLAQRTWVDVRGVDDTTAVARIAAAVRAEPHEADVLPDQPAPYRGLDTFTADDAAVFFGRDAEIAATIARLRSDSIVTVVGASGSGKSSLVHAGLVPRLAELDGRRWRWFTCTPGAAPFRALAAQVARLAPAGVSPVDETDRLTARFESRDDGLATALDAYDPDRADSVLLVIDQFEELFTHPATTVQQAQRFVANIVAAAELGGGRVKIAATMRADFLGRALLAPGMSTFLQDRELMLGALSEEQLREVITRPAERVGARLENGLVSRIVDDAIDRPGSLPLVQHALHQVWLRRSGRVLTVNGYDAAGGIGGALSSSAEAAFEGLTPEQQQLAQGLMVRLVNLGEGVPDTRRRAPRSRLHPDGVDRAEIDTILTAFSSSDARLLVTTSQPVLDTNPGALAEPDSEPAVDAGMVEIGHEALLTNWARLRGWLDQDRDAHRVRRRLSETAVEWEATHDPGLLYRGRRLADTTELTTNPFHRLNATEARFLDASRDSEREFVERERRHSRRTRRLLVATTIGLVATVVAAIGLVVALRQADSARTEADRRADEATGLALVASSRTAQPENSALALALAAESTAATDTPLPQAVEALVDARIAFSSQPYQQIGEPLTGHTDWVWGVAFSPDGSTLASASADGTVRLWDPTTGNTTTELTGHTSTVWGVAFSPDGSTLASASADGTVRLWDPTTGNTTTELTGHTDTVRGVAFSPDGSTLASASTDGTVRLWDRVWSSEWACALAAPYVTAGQIAEYLPEGQPTLCTYTEWGNA